MNDCVHVLSIPKYYKKHKKSRMAGLAYDVNFREFLKRINECKTEEELKIVRKMLKKSYKDGNIHKLHRNVLSDVIESTMIDLKNKEA